MRSARTMFIWAGKRLPFGISVIRRLIWMCNSKNFERHFQESRHAFGMRALGLPNTKHFHEITKIEDAMTRTCFTVFVLLRVRCSCTFSGRATEARG